MDKILKQLETAGFEISLTIDKKGAIIKRKETNSILGFIYNNDNIVTFYSKYNPILIKGSELIPYLKCL